MYGVDRPDLEYPPGEPKVVDGVAMRPLKPCPYCERQANG
jgi:hypothetical protein